MDFYASQVEILFWEHQRIMILFKFFSVLNVMLTHAFSLYHLLLHQNLYHLHIQILFIYLFDSLLYIILSIVPAHM